MVATAAAIKEHKTPWHELKNKQKKKRLKNQVGYNKSFWFSILKVRAYGVCS